VYNFISDEYFRQNSGLNKENRNSPQIKFIAVGSIKPQKNYEFLIKVLVELKNLGKTNISLDVYGGGALLANYREEVKQLGVNIDFKGEILHLAETYPRYDAFIMASLYEGCSVAIMEAFASRLPALLPDLDVIRETTNSHAVFFNVESVNDCVIKIVDFCNKKYNTAELIENGFLWVKNIAQKSTYINTLSKYYGI
jgi:glycosyltransferase involved in cell wall biosynthesis